MVLSCWYNSSVQGWKAFVLMEKFKALKLVLKGWSKQVFGNLEFQIDSLKEAVRKLDVVIDQISNSNEEFMNALDTLQIYGIC